MAALTSATCACYCFALASCVFEDVFCSDCVIRVGVLPALSWSLSGVRVEKNCEKFFFFQMTFFCDSWPGRAFAAASRRWVRAATCVVKDLRVDSTIAKIPATQARTNSTI